MCWSPTFISFLFFFFFLVAFKIFFTTMFCHLKHCFLVWSSLCWFCWGNFCASCIWISVSFPDFGRFSSYFFKLIFYLFSLSSLRMTWSIVPLNSLHLFSFCFFFSLIDQFGYFLLFYPPGHWFVLLCLVYFSFHLLCFSSLIGSFLFQC